MYIGLFRVVYVNQFDTNSGKRVLDIGRLVSHETSSAANYTWRVTETKPD